MNDEVILKNLTFSKIDIENDQDTKNIIKDLKIIYEDHWKNLNKINTSIKLPLKVKIRNLDSMKISNFEKILHASDLIYEFYITKFDKDFTYYQILYNGTPNSFLKTMKKNNLDFDTQNKTWILK